MEFAFTDDQLAFRDTVRDFLEAECPAHAVRATWEGGPGWDPAVWSKLAAMGVVGLGAPESVGGLGMGELDLVLLLEEAGRAAFPGPLLETAAVAIPLLRDLGELRWVSEAAAGDAVVAVGLAADPFVAYADSAAVLLLQHGDDVHAVAPAGVALVPETSVDRSRRLWRVQWSPSAATRLARGETGRAALRDAFDRGALAAAAQLCGVAAHLVEAAVDYAGRRHQFGVPIGSYQAVKHRLADSLLALEYARPVVYRAAYAVHHHELDRHVAVSMAKAYASDAATGAARAALQVHGAIGYTWEHDLHLWLKRSWALAGAWGDAAWHRRRVADAVLGPPTSGRAPGGTRRAPG